MKLEICRVRAINGNQGVLHNALEALLDQPLGELNPERKRLPHESLVEFSERFAQINKDRQCWRLVDWDMELDSRSGESFWVVTGEVEFMPNPAGQLARRIMCDRLKHRVVPRTTASDIPGIHLRELFAIDIISPAE